MRKLAREEEPVKTVFATCDFVAARSGREGKNAIPKDQSKNERNRHDRRNRTKDGDGGRKLGILSVLFREHEVKHGVGMTNRSRLARERQREQSSGFR